MTLHELTIAFEEFDSATELPEDEQRLILSAWEARRYAYSPYSHFQVGAAVSTNKVGRIFLGSNQENANFKVSCAERVVLDSRGAIGLKHLVNKIAIVGGPDSMNPYHEAIGLEEPVTPCGQCRQDIKEVEDIAGQPTVIIMASRNRVRRIVGIKNLLPFAFGPADLGK